MFHPPALPALLAFVFTVWLSAAAGQPPPTQKQVPPPGVAIPDADRAELQKGVSDLGAKLGPLLKNPQTAPLAADVAVLHKAVDWALRHDEFLDVKQVKTARELLAEGQRRAEDLRAGKSGWIAPGQGGLRGYRSRLDDSIQPYGVLVPADWRPGERQARPVVLWFHGRAEKLTELDFCAQQMKPKCDLVVPGAITINLYGRFCNASKFAGEVDAFEALEDLARRTPIDRRRVAVAGFSMGGASVWHFSTHHAGKWAAATPGAGFAETPIYAGVFKPGKPAVPWWEQMLWNLYDAPPYAENLVNTSLLAYSGEIDPQKASADLMKGVLSKLGMKLERRIGPKTGHKYEPGVKKEIEAWLSAKLAEGRPAVPAKVRHVTYTLRYPSCEWVRIDGLERHWQRAEIAAEIVDTGTIRVATNGVTAFTLRFDADPVPLDKARLPRVIVDGQELTGPAVAKPWAVSFLKRGGKWSDAKGERETGLAKEPGRQGPIDDAFMDRFIFVRPTGVPLHADVAAWAKSELERAVTEWRRVFRGDALVKDDTALTPEDIAGANLVLWGDAASNAVLARVLPSLPLKWTKTTLELGPHKLDPAHHVPVLIHPNPLNPRRYVVLNSSFTFRMGSRTSNSLQTPKLPDWALIDLRTPPDDTAPGLIYDAGFFDEHWRP
jgi:predicted esterase